MTTDATDARIIECLQADGRAPVADIARAVALSPAAVSRRIARLEASGVIKGYTAVIDQTKTGGLDAFIAVRLAGAIDSGELASLVQEIPETRAHFTLAGDLDMIVRVHVADGDQLQKVVNSLRRTGKLAGTKTSIILDAWVRY